MARSSSHDDRFCIHPECVAAAKETTMNLPTNHVSTGEYRRPEKGELFVKVSATGAPIAVVTRNTPPPANAKFWKFAGGRRAIVGLNDMGKLLALAKTAASSDDCELADEADELLASLS